MTTAIEEQIQVAPISTNSAKEFNDQAVVLTDRANNLQITNQVQYESAASMLRTVKSMADTLEVARKKITKPLDDAKKAVMDLFRSPSDDLVKAEADIKRKMIAYSNEQERIRREQEEKLRREAAAEEARQRKIKEDQERAWREKEEKARKEAEELAAAGREEDARKAREVADMAAEKAKERAQQAQEVSVQAPIVAPTVEKLKGISMMKNWKARVVNVDEVPRTYMTVNEQALDKIAKATKGSLTIPGVEFYSEDVLASRG